MRLGTSLALGAPLCLCSYIFCVTSKSCWQHAQHSCATWQEPSASEADGSVHSGEEQPRAHAAAHAVTHGFSAAPGALRAGSNERIGDQAASSPALAAVAWRVKVARQAPAPVEAPFATAAMGSPGIGGRAPGQLAGIAQQSAGGAEQSISPHTQADAHAQARVQAVYVPKAWSEQSQPQLPVTEDLSELCSHGPGLDVHGGAESAAACDSPAHARAVAAPSARASGAGIAAPGSGAALQQEAGAAARVNAGQPALDMELERLHAQGGAPRRLPGSWPGAAGSAHEGRAGGAEPVCSAPGQAPGGWHGTAPGGQQGVALGGRVDGAPGGWQGAPLGGAADGAPSGRQAQYDAAMAALFARLQPIGVRGERGALCCLAL